MKILWFSDIYRCTGFSRVSEEMIKYLVESCNCQVTVIGPKGTANPARGALEIIDVGTPVGEYDFESYSEFYKSVFPTADLTEITKNYIQFQMIHFIKEQSPDFLIVLNSVDNAHDFISTFRNVCENAEYSIPKIIGFVTVDNKYDLRNLKRPWTLLNKFDSLITLTHEAKQVLKSLGVTIPIGITPHGVNPQNFKKLDKAETRKKLFKEITGKRLHDDDFIIFNGNRNVQRKRLDITLKAFAKFQNNKQKCKLWIHSGDGYYNINKLCKKYKIKDKVIITSSKGSMYDPKGLSQEKLNEMYNCMDIGINTSSGEGWGLVSFEMSLLGIPQIVPDFLATGEIFKKDGFLVTVKEQSSGENIEGIVDVDSCVNQLEYLFNPDHVIDIQGKTKKMKEYTENLTWDHVTQQFYSLLLKSL